VIDEVMSVLPSKADKTPFLSVCIATLNRREYLSETLDKFAQQMCQDVEVLVLDGGSQDGTPLMMQEYAERYAWLRYVRLSKNGGIDADYDQCVRQARGQYCWLFSDDDWPLQGALDKVIDTCKGGHDFIYIDAQVLDKNMDQVLADRRVTWRGDRTIASGHTDEVFRLAGAGLSFIGSCIVRRQVWLSRDCTPYYGYYFPHIAMLFQKPLEGSACLLDYVGVAIRYGNATWSAKSFQIWALLWPELIWKLQGISAKAKQSVSAHQPWRKPLFLLWQRAKGVYNTHSYTQYIEPLMTNSAHKFWIKALSYIPGVLVLLTMLLLLRVFRPHNKFLVAELMLSIYYRPVWMKFLVKYPI
jgi:abequosyltransferase